MQSLKDYWVVAAMLGCLGVTGCNAEAPQSEQVRSYNSAFEVGVYQLVAEHSGKCMEVAGASGSNGSNIVQSECNHEDHQLWQLVPRPRGSYRLVAQHSGKCMRASDNNPLFGLNVQQGACRYKRSKWLLTESEMDVIQLQNARTERCAAVIGGSMEDGANVGQLACTDQDAQRFRLVPVGDGTPGCNATEWPANGRYSLDVGGTMREFVFTAPEGYDASTPMRLMFVWHGLGGTIDDMDNPYFGYYGMAQVNDGSAILVAGQGLPSSAGGTDYAWRNTDGEDTAFTQAMVDWFSANFCIDPDRILSTGMSYGGIMSNTVGCELGDVFRAIAPIAGAGPGFGGVGDPDCVGQVAAVVIHGAEDGTVPVSMGEASRDYWVGANSCSSSTTSVDPTEYCVAYTGCDAGFPVHWCLHQGGHTIPDFAAQTIWDFFVQL